MPSWTLAPNIAQINRTVRSTSWMRDLGTIGDTSHQAGAGDHTPWSTHSGKYGYPTQGQVHAQDVGASDYMLDLIETFIRRSWRRGELSGIKYVNVLNRHWNIQSTAAWNRAKAGTISPTYSGDHHLHLSMENGTIDGDVLDRFIAWYNAGQKFPDEIEEDDMANLFDDMSWSGDEKQSFANRIYRSYRAAEAASVKLDDVNKELDELKAAVAKIQVGGVDIQALAAALGPMVSKTVNDEFARRQAD